MSAAKKKPQRPVRARHRVVVDNAVVAVTAKDLKELADHINDFMTPRHKNVLDGLVMLAVLEEHFGQILAAQLGMTLDDAMGLVRDGARQLAKEMGLGQHKQRLGPDGKPLS